MTIVSGTNVRFGLMERRTELIRCASITKDRVFDAQIAAIDEALADIWNTKEIELMVIK
jgi:hypothetical protein